MCFPPKFQWVQLHGVLFFADPGLPLCKPTSTGLILRECAGDHVCPSSLSAHMCTWDIPKGQRVAVSFCCQLLRWGLVLKSASSIGSRQPPCW